mgnify:CR=1 FL=1
MVGGPLVIIGGVVVRGVTIRHKWSKKHKDNKSNKIKYRLKEKVKNKGEKCLKVIKSRKYY